MIRYLTRDLTAIAAAVAASLTTAAVLLFRTGWPDANMALLLAVAAATLADQAGRGARGQRASPQHPVRKTARTMSDAGRLIVGTSGSPGSLCALRYAEATARARNAILIPAIAWEPPGGDRADRVQPSGYLRQEWRSLAAQRLRDALIAVWGEVPDDPLVEPHVERGPAGWVLVNLADRPDDLLIVGAGRRGTLARMAFSRVGRYCLAHAQCPVLTVPPAVLAQEIGHGRLAWLFWHRTLTPARVLRDQDGPADQE